MCKKTDTNVETLEIALEMLDSGNCAHQLLILHNRIAMIRACACDHDDRLFYALVGYHLEKAEAAMRELTNPGNVSKAIRSVATAMHNLSLLETSRSRALGNCRS